MLCEQLTMSDELYNAIVAYKDNDKLIDENPKNLTAFNQILQGLNNLTDETDEYKALRKNVEARLKEIESTEKTIADLITPSFNELCDIASNEFIGKIILNDYYDYNIIIFVDNVQVTRSTISVKGTTFDLRILRIDSSKTDSYKLFHLDGTFLDGTYLDRRSTYNKIIDKEYMDKMFDDTVDYKRFQLYKIYDSIHK